MPTPIYSEYVHNTSGGGGGGGTTIGAPVTGGTNGSILFVDPTGNLAQDNNNLFFDSALFALSVGGDVNIGGNFSGVDVTASGIVSATKYRILTQDTLSADYANDNLYVGDTMPPLTGTSNVTLGRGAGIAITSGNQNTLAGASAGILITTGSQNTMLGHAAGQSLVSGGMNSFFGDASGANNIGTGNTGVGSVSLSTGSGNYNTGVGLQALDSLTTGATNTGIGVNAGASVTSGSDNALIGRNADVLTGSLSNASAFGANATINASNAMMLGSSSVNVGIGLVNSSIPTARLHIPGGSATANSAPLKLNSGTLLTTPEAGAIENDGTNLYYTDNTPTRHALSSGQVLAFFSDPVGAGAADATLVVTGLLATDTIIAVSQSTRGATTAALIGWSGQANDALTGHWSADPGGLAVVQVAVKR